MKFEGLCPGVGDEFSERCLWSERKSLYIRFGRYGSYDELHCRVVEKAKCSVLGRFGHLSEMTGRHTSVG